MLYQLVNTVKNLCDCEKKARGVVDSVKKN